MKERVGNAELLASVLDLAAQRLSNAGPDGFKLELVLALDLLTHSLLRHSGNVLRKIEALPTSLTECHLRLSHRCCWCLKTANWAYSTV